MFTGIVTDIGRIVRVDDQGDTRIEIETGYDTAGIALGASIACSGVCLTVVDTCVGKDGAPGRFAVDVSGETRSRTAARQWTEGRRLNLERAMKLGDELGGHIVTGHVDGVATVADLAAEGGSTRIGFTLPADLAALVATKGSITVNGVSLTVNEVDDAADGSARIGVNVIPHTRAATTLGDLAVGDQVNIEIDVLARYLQRMQSHAARR